MYSVVEVAPPPPYADDAVLDAVDEAEDEPLL